MSAQDHQGETWQDYNIRMVRAGIWYNAKEPYLEGQPELKQTI